MTSCARVSLTGLTLEPSEKRESSFGHVNIMSMTFRRREASNTVMQPWVRYPSLPSLPSSSQTLSSSYQNMEPNMDNLTNPWLTGAGSQTRCEQCDNILLDGQCIDCPPAARVEVCQASRDACQMGSVLAKGGCKQFLFCYFFCWRGRGVRASTLPV